MRIRRKLTTKLNTKLMVDIIGASLIVQQVPALLQQWFKLDETISKVGAVGVGYVVGSMINRPDLANASIALFATDMIMPAIGGILPSTPQTNLLPSGAPVAVRVPVNRTPTPSVTIDDYFSLNDYVANPGQSAPFSMYRESY